MKQSVTQLIKRYNDLSKQIDILLDYLSNQPQITPISKSFHRKQLIDMIQERSYISSILESRGIRLN